MDKGGRDPDVYRELVKSQNGWSITSKGPVVSDEAGARLFKALGHAEHWLLHHKMWKH